MTAILFDGFDHGDIAHRWTNVRHGTTTSPVRTGTHALRLGDGTGGQTYLSLQTSEEDDVMYCGFGFNNLSQAGDVVVCEFASNLGTVSQLSLIRRGGIRGWEIRRGAEFHSPGNGTQLVAPVPNMWFPTSWHYIEFGAKVADSGGWVEMRQDGVTRLRFDGDTRNGGDGLVDHIGFSHLTNLGVYLLDDVYMLNEQGSVNSTWLADTRCFPLYPIGNGFYLMLLGSDGNSIDNYLLVDEAGTPVTTDYVGSAVVGDKDTYEFQDLTVTLGTIRGIEGRLHAAKDDTGTKQARMIGRRSGTDFQGVDKVLAAIPLFQTHHQIWELDPITAAVWTIPNVNATEWGVEVRA